MSEPDRYERYKAWCLLLEVPAASFETWRRESMKIPEVRGITIWDFDSFSSAHLMTVSR